MGAFPDSLGWTRDEYVTLINVACEGAFQPEHWLQFATVESVGLVKTRACASYPTGRGPFACNPNGNAKGLWQAMPMILKNLGWKAGNSDYDAANGDFREAGVSTQIKWSGRYLAEWRARFGIVSWDRPGDLYLCNFAPAFLRYKNEPGKVIFDGRKTDVTGRPTAEARIYQVNRGLDFGRKGYICVGDMAQACVGATGNLAYRQAVRSLNRMLQQGLNDRGFGDGLNPTGKGRLEVDGVAGYFTNLALKKFWDSLEFAPEDRQLDAHTRKSLI